MYYTLIFQLWYGPCSFAKQVLTKYTLFAFVVTVWHYLIFDDHMWYMSTKMPWALLKPPWSWTQRVQSCRAAQRELRSWSKSLRQKDCREYQIVWFSIHLIKEFQNLIVSFGIARIAPQNNFPRTNTLFAFVLFSKMLTFFDMCWPYLVHFDKDAMGIVEASLVMNWANSKLQSGSKRSTFTK